MNKCDILIYDTTVMKDYKSIYEHMDIAIKDGLIISVKPSKSEKFEAHEKIDGRTALYMPGLIDSHMHTGQQLLKGQVLDEKPIIWTRIMLPFESSLTPKLMHLSAESAALEMIRFGTTSFVESGSYFMEEAAEVYRKSGLRGCLSCSTMDEAGLPESIAMNADEAVMYSDRLYENWNGQGNLKVYYSLRALNACSDELVKKVVEHAGERNAVIQAHMNEYQSEIDGIISREGIRPYEYLEKMGALSEKFLGAHSLILSEKEKELIRDAGAVVCHCPFSNCAKAVPETTDLISRGIIPGFGTDGASHGGLSLWNEMRIFRSLMNLIFGVPNKNPRIMPAETLFKMMFEGGAAAISEKGRTGKIEEGCKADMIGIDLNLPSMMPSENLIHTLFECADGAAVKDMIVAGKIIMKNREIMTLDEEKILYELKKYIKQMRRID